MLQDNYKGTLPVFARLVKASASKPAFKIERQTFEAMRYEHNPELMPPLSDNDPVVIRDNGNDIEIVCNKTCLMEYLGLNEV